MVVVGFDDFIGCYGFVDYVVCGVCLFVVDFVVYFLDVDVGVECV